MLHTSYIELSKGALHNNIRFMKTHIHAPTRYSMVIKSNAYGHGIEHLLPIIEECGVSHFSVFSIDEAVQAYEVKSKECEIMIMGWIDNDNMDWAIEHGVSFYVFTIERLKAAIKASHKLKKKAKVHLELETGMHRTGLYKEELDEVVELLRHNQEYINVEGTCTHYAGAENISNHDRVQDQIKVFNELCGWLYRKGIKPHYRHTACSAAVLKYPETVMDLVRVGIANYGFWPSGELRMDNMLKRNSRVDPLKRVLSWKSEVMSVKQVNEGEFISYGKSYVTNRDVVIATIPVGYGYGFSRNLSNLGHVLIHGKRVRVIGTVNMNMMIVDVTDLNDVEIGDEVVLIGEQNGLSISVSSFSDMNYSLNYEQLTRLPHDIPRYIVD